MIEPLKDFKVPQSPCPGCGTPLDGATGEETPKPGDFTVCIVCRHIAVFDDDRTLREPTKEELKEVGGDPDLKLLLNAIVKAQSDSRRKRVEKDFPKTAK